MKVAFEATGAIGDQPTGIGHYIRHLVQAVSAMDGDISPTLFYKASRLKHRSQWYRPEGIPVRMYHGSIWPPFRSVDIVHGLDATLPHWKHCKKIVTIHDLLPLLNDTDEISPAGFRRRLRSRYEAAIEAADLVVADSECTRRDLIDYFQVTEERVVAVPLGADVKLFKPQPPDRVHALRSTLGLPQNYFLFVGALSGRKNTERLVRAFAQSQARNQFILVLAGGLSYRGESTIEAIKALKLQDRVVLLDYVSETDLPALYSGARGFLFPTLYEGFGLPILEAMCCGVPVLTSNTGSAPEVGGPHVLQVDPLNTDAISAGIDALLSKEQTHLKAAAGYAREFTWSRCAKRMIEIYQQVSGQGTESP